MQSEIKNNQDLLQEIDYMLLLKRIKEYFGEKKGEQNK